MSERSYRTFRGALRSPAVLVTLITVFGGALGTWLTFLHNRGQLELEAQKHASQLNLTKEQHTAALALDREKYLAASKLERQKHDSGLIFKVLEGTNDLNVMRTNLLFILKSKLIEDTADGFIERHVQAIRPDQLTFDPTQSPQVSSESPTTPQSATPAQVQPQPRVQSCEGAGTCPQPAK